MRMDQENVEMKNGFQTLMAAPKNIQALYLSVSNNPTHSAMVIQEEGSRILSILNPSGQDGSERSIGLQLKDAGAMEMGIQGDKAAHGGRSVEYKKGVATTLVNIIGAMTLPCLHNAMLNNSDGFFNRFCIVSMGSKASSLRE